MPYIISHYLPELDEPERSFLAQLTATMSEIGTIVDIVNHKELAFRYNKQVARRIASNLLSNRRGTSVEEGAPLQV